MSKLSLQEAEEKEQAYHIRSYNEAESCWFVVHKKRKESEYGARHPSQPIKVSKKKQRAVWLTPH